MSNEWGNIVAPVDAEGDVMHSLAMADAPRHGDRTPRQWMKENLFSTKVNTVITVIFGLISLYLAFRVGKFVFATARWEPVRANVELFMIGLFPREERTRIIAQLLLMSGAVGLLLGWLRQRSIRTAELAGLPRPSTSPGEIASTYWAIGVFVAFTMIVGVRTLDPWLLLIACVAGAAAAFVVTMRLANPLAKLAIAAPLVIAAGVLTRVPDLDNGATYLIAIIATVGFAAVALAKRPTVTLTVGALFAVSAFQALSGTHGLAWVFLTAAAAPLVLDVIAVTSERTPAVAGFVGSALFAGAGLLLISLSGVGPESIIAFALALAGAFAAARGDAGLGVRLGALAVVGVVMWQIGRVIDISGINWKEWGGLHLNLVVAAATTLLAFPIGLLLALGRRSSLPVLRWMCTTYIEIIRGVPLITLLFMAQLFVGFFLNGANLPLPTKSIIVFTMFSSAYIAEIVRGGLQAVPKGQTEAGQAMGMSPAAITRLLVLPQALKAVIPAMVGQFISLFKDTSLLTIIGIPEILGVRNIVHAQAEFRGFGIAETLVYVALAFWAFSFAMSRESQRLERRLDTGAR